jgi:hypothetical protein
MQYVELPLQIGETVTYDNHGLRQGANGVIVQRLSDDYLRVKWSDMPVPTTHRSDSLIRSGALRHRRH